MNENEQTGTVDDLFTRTVRDRLGEDSYGSWRSVDAPDAVSLSFGFPFPASFPTDDLVAATEAVIAEDGDDTLQYGGGEYTDRLVVAIVEHEREFGIDCDRDNILLTNGSTHAIDVVNHTFLERGDEVFVEAPTFMGALTLFKNYGVELTGIETDVDGLNVTAVAAALEERRDEGRASPKLLYTIPTFQNPSGTTMPLGRRKRLLDLAAEYNFVILEDDAYGSLRYYGDAVPPLKALDETGQVVRVSTFSKTIAPGVRTGWILADETILDEVGRMRAGGTNTFTQSVLGRYCAEGNFGENVADLRAAYKERCDHMLECLDEHMPPAAEWTNPDGGFFVWVELPEDIDAEAMLPTAAKEGVTYLPGELFFPNERGKNCLRLSFSEVSFEEMERGIEALARAMRTAIVED